MSWWDPLGWLWVGTGRQEAPGLESVWRPWLSQWPLSPANVIIKHPHPLSTLLQLSPWLGTVGPQPTCPVCPVAEAVPG
jgi:hypothetical protein